MKTNKLSRLIKPNQESKNIYNINIQHVDNIYVSSKSNSSVETSSPTPSEIKKEKLREENRVKERKIIKKYPTRHDFYNVPDKDQKEIKEEIARILRRIDEKQKIQK